METFRPEREFVKFRNSTFRTGFWFLIPSIILWKILVNGFGIDPYSEAPMLMWPIGLVGVIMIFSGIRREEYITFKSTSGVPLVSIARSRKRTDEFELFIQSLIERIDALRKMGEQIDDGNAGKPPCDEREP